MLRKERAEHASAAKQSLRKFLLRLDRVLSSKKKEAVLGLDPRFRQLADDLEAARHDTANFKSKVMRDGPRSTIALLDCADVPSKHALLESLSELRRLVSRHQQSDTAAILEDF